MRRHRCYISQSQVPSNGFAWRTCSERIELSRAVTVRLEGRPPSGEVGQLATCKPLAQSRRDHPTLFWANRLRG